MGIAALALIGVVIGVVIARAIASWWGSRALRDDDMDWVVLTILHREFLNRDYLTQEDKATCEKEIERIRQLMEWATGLTKEQGRQHYMKWLTFFAGEFQRRIAEIEAEARQATLLPTVPKPPF
jgi:hypothetical protein